MPKYLVEIEETLKYKIEVDAENKEQAEDLAYNDQKFTSSISDDNDSKVTSVEEI